MSAEVAQVVPGQVGNFGPRFAPPSCPFIGSERTESDGIRARTQPLDTVVLASTVAMVVRYAISPTTTTTSVWVAWAKVRHQRQRLPNAVPFKIKTCSASVHTFAGPKTRNQHPDSGPDINPLWISRKTPICIPHTTHRPPGSLIIVRFAVASLGNYTKCSRW